MYKNGHDHPVLFMRTLINTYSLKFLNSLKLLAKITVTRTYRTKLNTNRMSTQVHVNVVAIILFQ